MSYIYKIYFNKVKEEIEANYHTYVEGYLRFYRGFHSAETEAELVAEFDESKITGWQRVGTKRDKPKLGFIHGGKTEE